MTRIRPAFIAFLVCGSAAVLAQGMSEDVKQKAAAAKEAAARNQRALLNYSWITKTSLSVKGEVKNTKIEACQYGPDGKVQKTELSEPPPPPQKGRGLKGMIVAKKTAEMKEEMENSAALVHGYVPPAPDKLQAVIAAGKVTLTPSPGAATIRFADYVKSGDSLTLTLDREAKTMRKIAVDTWLDEPKNKVTLEVTFASLPDGTNYAGTTLLKIPESKIEVRIENSNYQKIR